MVLIIIIIIIIITPFCKHFIIKPFVGLTSVFLVELISVFLWVLISLTSKFMMAE